MQLLLSSPDITCEHCIATIERVAGETDGVAFVSGDPDRRTFVVEVSGGAALDQFGAALAAEGYPLGDVASEQPDAHGSKSLDWAPGAYRVERTDVGANVNYDCYCGCDAGFALDRSQGDQATESCCCGNHILVGVDAGGRIAGKLDDPSAYRIDVQTVAMPWGQPVEVALAIPNDG
ncbi:MAG: heavy-metal-associated domain-containing protein [Dehalococcoidia bacterium]|nr:heavy-metal-associated domain-containing protein [Dehalococcoidia bacterium]